MKITKWWWLTVVGLGSVFALKIPCCLAQTASSAASPSTSQLAVVAPAPSARPSASQSPAAVQPANAVSSSAAAPAIAPASASTSGARVAGAQTAALSTGSSPQRDRTPLGRQLYEAALDGARLDPFNWVVRVFKSRHRVEVYYRDRLFTTYHAVFGRGDGGKEWAGDTRTPEGSYLIIEKHPSARFDWFLTLNYPNGIDVERFEALRAGHEIPDSSRAGSKIGIHGTDSPVLNVQDVNWTLGCISVDNRDISEMASLLPVGTLVVINP